MTLTRRQFLAAAPTAIPAVAALLAAVRTVHAAAAPTPITVYKTAACGCCQDWVSYLAGKGFAPRVVDQSDAAMAETRLTVGVPEALWSCHTAVVGRLVVEGHVPAEDIRAALAAATPPLGLAVPGMPLSAPGMKRTGDPHVPYDVMAWGPKGATRRFARR